MPDEAAGFRCRLCGRISHHPEDAINRDCPCCGSWPLLPKDCAHTRHRRAQRALRAMVRMLRRDADDASKPPSTHPPG